ncbi:hypothetical protein GCM10028864_16750 [Microlunatus parietis]
MGFGVIGGVGVGVDADGVGVVVDGVDAEGVGVIGVGVGATGPGGLTAGRATGVGWPASGSANWTCEPQPATSSDPPTASPARIRIPRRSRSATTTM